MKKITFCTLLTATALSANIAMAEPKMGMADHVAADVSEHVMKHAPEASTETVADVAVEMATEEATEMVKDSAAETVTAKTTDAVTTTVETTSENAVEAATETVTETSSELAVETITDQKSLMASDAAQKMLNSNATVMTPATKEAVVERAASHAKQKATAEIKADTAKKLEETVGMEAKSGMSKVKEMHTDHATEKKVMEKSAEHAAEDVAKDAVEKAIDTPAAEEKKPFYKKWWGR